MQASAGTPETVGRLQYVSRFTGLSPCTMAQIATRQRILASQNLSYSTNLFKMS